MGSSFDAHWIPKNVLIRGDPADADSPNFFWQGDLYTTVASTSARNIFTTIFVLLNLLNGVVGVYLLQWRNAAKLLRHGPTVPLYTLSPWMSASDTFIYRWYTGHLPGGHYGFFMLTTGIFGIVHQYFTSSFISSVPNYFGDCKFSTGVVFLPPSDERVTPGSMWPAADIALNSQFSAARHGDPPGIYAKANSDTNFTVTIDSPDHLGNWTCAESGNVTFPPNTSIDTINSQLTDEQYLYSKSQEEWHMIPGEPDTLDGLLLWGSSDPDDTGKTWGVKASIAPSSGLNQPVVMYNYECAMQGPQIEWILPLISSAKTLVDWSPRTFGNLVQGSDVVNPGNSTSFGFTLEVTLNAIVMVAGSLNIATRPANGSYNSPSTYRCNLERTIIRKEVFIMLGFVLFHFLVFVPLGIKYWIQIRWSDRSRREAIKEIPSNASSWQVAVLRDHFPGKGLGITAKDIPKYRYGWDADGSNVLRFSEKDSATDHVEQISFLPKMDTNTRY